MSKNKKVVPVDDSFPNVPAVLVELQGRGIKVSRATLFNDIRAGKLPRQVNGRFSRLDVDNYAAVRLAKHAIGAPGQTSADAATDAELARQKTIAEIARIKGVIRAQDLDYKVKIGELCKSADFYRALAVRVTVLRQRLRSMFQAHILDYQRMSPEDAVEAFFEDLDQALHEYSRPPEFEAERVPDVFNLEEDVLGSLDDDGDDEDDESKDNPNEPNPEN